VGSKGTMRSVTLTEFGTEEGFSFMKNVRLPARSFGWAADL
jgi:hypothetical protein